MRMTLEQLKAMSDNELWRAWQIGEFPFDRVASCGGCLTQHHHGSGIGCHRLAHQALVEQVERIKYEAGNPFGYYSDQITTSPSPKMLREHLEELYALRLYFDSLYPQAAEPLAVAPAEQPMETVLQTVPGPISI